MRGRWARLCWEGKVRDIHPSKESCFTLTVVDSRESAADVSFLSSLLRRFRHRQLPADGAAGGRGTLRSDRSGGAGAEALVRGVCRVVGEGRSLKSWQLSTDCA